MIGTLQRIISPFRLCGFVLVALAAGQTVHAQAPAQETPAAFVLSQNQIRSLKLIEEFSVVRIDWNRSTVGRPLAYSLRGEALKSFQTHLPGMPYNPDKKPQRERLNSQGIVVCRLILRTLADIWALFMRCELGNQLTVIIRREDLIMFDRQPTWEDGRLMMDSQIQRLAATLLEARKKPDTFAE